MLKATFHLCVFNADVVDFLNFYPRWRKLCSQQSIFDLRVCVVWCEVYVVRQKFLPLDERPFERCRPVASKNSSLSRECAALVRCMYMDLSFLLLLKALLCNLCIAFAQIDYFTYLTHPAGQLGQRDLSESYTIDVMITVLTRKTLMQYPVEFFRTPIQIL